MYIYVVHSLAQNLESMHSTNNNNYVQKPYVIRRSIELANSMYNVVEALMASSDYPDSDKMEALNQFERLTDLVKKNRAKYKELEYRKDSIEKTLCAM